jgi:D-alanyl-D-alanine carboxypeptidase
MHHKILAFGALVVASAFCAPARAEGPPITAQLQQILDNYVAQRAKIEDITGVALHVSLGSFGPVIDVSAGNDGLPKPWPLTADSLFEIGSNTKSMTSALILMLEAAGKLNINQTVGDWLPQYKAWKSVTIRSLLDMTSDIPSYDETVAMAEKQLDLHYQFTPEQLIGFVDPDQGNIFPPITGYYYSNTDYFLAGLIIEKASGMSYKEALERFILKPLDLRDTYYFYGNIPGSVLDRMPAGFYHETGCVQFQPMPCPTKYPGVLAPLFGKDVRAENMSWAGPAGGVISTLGDLARWYRALFGLRVIPRAQLDEMETLVSTKTGLRLAIPTQDDPEGFGLGIIRFYGRDPLLPSDSSFPPGPYWFYQGGTLGFRVEYAYWPQYNLVITVAANSDLPDVDAVYLQSIPLSSAFTALLNAGAIHDSGAGAANH